MRIPPEVVRHTLWAVQEAFRWQAQQALSWEAVEQAPFVRPAPSPVQFVGALALDFCFEEKTNISEIGYKMKFTIGLNEKNNNVL